jgi:hypothetical protein
MRKHIGEMGRDAAGMSGEPAPLAIDELATVFVTSEAAGHPIEHVFDGSREAGGSRWIAGAPGEQTLLLAFEQPQRVHRIVLDIEEPQAARTQELDIALSTDGGQTFRHVVRQEYTFSPPGTTSEHETWVVNTDPITHFRLRIKPDKGGGPFTATITSLQLY